MSKKFLTSMVLTSLVAGVSSLAMANNAPEEVLPTYDLDATVVTATKSSEKLLNIPAAADVVTAKDIAEHNYRTVSEAIASLPGVYMSPRPESGMGGNLSIRGFEGDDILVLLDGMPMNDTYNNDVSWDTLPMNNVAKIEVLRGSASALYGGRAVGAVVQIFTKDYNLAKGEVVTKVSTKYGTHHSWDNKINVNAGVSDKLTVGVGFEKRSSEGYPNYYVAKPTDKKNGTNSLGDYKDKVPYSPVSKRYLVGNRGDKGFDNKNFSATINYKFDEHKRLKYSYWHLDYKYFYRNPESFILDSNGKEVFKGVVGIGNKTITVKPKDFLGYEGFRVSNTHVLNYTDDQNNWQVNLGLVKESANGYGSPASTIKDIHDNTKGELSEHPGKTFNFDINKTWDNLGKHKVLLGASYKQENMTQVRRTLNHWMDRDSIIPTANNGGITALYGGKSKNTAVYVQDEYKVSEPLTLYLGARYDKFTKADGYTINFDGKTYKLKNSLAYPSTSYTQVSPKIALEYVAKDQTHYYASYSSSFNPPPLYEIYRDGGGGMGDVKANPQLVPERTKSYEVGFKKDINNKTQVAFDLFKTDTKDKIYYKKFLNDQQEVEYKQYVNGDREKRQGLELSLQHKFSKKYDGYLNYTNQHGKLFNNGKEDTDYRIPHQIFHAGVNYKLDRWKANLDLMYASSRQSNTVPTGSYGSEDPIFLVNTAINYKFSDRLEGQFAVSNLFDKKLYAEQAVDGRTFTFGLNYNF